MQNLEIVNADKLLYQTTPDIEFIVDGILPTGLHLFCGASKVGKSWLMLDLAIKVSKGEEMWNLQTKKADVRDRKWVQKRSLPDFDIRWFPRTRKRTAQTGVAVIHGIGHSASLCLAG